MFEKCGFVTLVGLVVAGLLPYVWLPGFKRKTRARGATRLIEETQEKESDAQEDLHDKSKAAREAESKLKAMEAQSQKRPIPPPEGGRPIDRDIVFETPAAPESTAPAPAADANDLTNVKNAAHLAVKNMQNAEHAARKAAQDRKDAEELEKIWPKLSQPEYAIGLGILSKADYDALVTTYQTKSTLVVGLTLPMLLLTAILLIRIGGYYQGYAASPNSIDWWYIVLGLLEAALFIAAADLKHKFEMSMQAAIAAAYAKMIEAKKEADTPAKKLSDQIANALKSATIVQGTNLKIVPSDQSSTPPAMSSANSATAGGDANASDAEGS